MKRAIQRVLVTAVTVIAVAAAGCNRSEPQPSANNAAPPSAAPATTAEPRGDAALATAVQAKFYTDERVRGHDLDVSAEGGTVTLRGTVPTQAAKEQAVTLARSVEGVSNVNDQIQAQDTGATGTTGRAAEARQPWWITTKIQAQYFADADVKPWNIDVTTSSGGVVTLDGTVENPEAKNEAVRIARETEGVTRVEDRLRVEADARRTDAARNAGDASAVGQPDAWLTAKVQAKYFIDEEVKARDIDVETRNGVVTLKGTVGSEAEHRQAIAIARNTDGVRDVTDNLRVDTSIAVADSTRQDRGAGSPDQPSAGKEPGVQPSAGAKAKMDRPDAWITMKIQSKYFLDADVKGHEIDVDTKNGMVTLKGHVENAQQKAEAEQIARETEGVTRVNNQLTVGAPSVSGQ
jgi:osmotically-inducible protein OsmY